MHHVGVPLGVQLCGWTLFCRSAVRLHSPAQRPCLQSTNGRQRHTMHKLLNSDVNSNVVEGQDEAERQRQGNKLYAKTESNVKNVGRTLAWDTQHPAGRWRTPPTAAAGWSRTTNSAITTQFVVQHTTVVDTSPESHVKSRRTTVAT